DRPQTASGRAGALAPLRPPDGRGARRGPARPRPMKKTVHLSPGGEGASEDVRRKIELHLELRAREFEAQGMSPEAAREAALAAFGDRRAIESEVRDMRGTTLRERQRRDRFGELVQ